MWHRLTQLALAVDVASGSESVSSTELERACQRDAALLQALSREPLDTILSTTCKLLPPDLLHSAEGSRILVKRPAADHLQAVVAQTERLRKDVAVLAAQHRALLQEVWCEVTISGHESLCRPCSCRRRPQRWCA